MTTREGTYIAGDYYLQCEVCGFDRRRSEAVRRWDGAMVCSPSVKGGCYEERHPLDQVEPRPEQQNVLDARYADPVFVTDNQVQPGDL